VLNVNANLLGSLLLTSFTVMVVLTITNDVYAKEDKISSKVLQE